MSLKVYQHILTNEEGRRIANEQDKTLERVGLLSYGVFRGESNLEDIHQLYEGITLQELWTFSSESEEDIPVCYIHTKGATASNRIGAEKWRHSMEAVVLHKWKQCVEALEACDCYGAHLPIDDRYFFPGNFWWSKTSHIKRLPSPIEWAEKLCGRKGVDVRYGYEDWITLSREGVVAKADSEWTNR